MKLSSKIISLHEKMLSDSETSSYEEETKKRKIEGVGLPNYKYVCKRKGIPYPIVSSREHEHLNKCSSCREVWPMFYAFNKPMYDFKEICLQWASMTETNRIDEYEKHLAPLREIATTRVPSGYQLFLRDKSKSEQFKNISFGEKSKHLSKMWKNLNSEEKDLFKHESENLKEKKKEYVTNLPKLKRQLYLAEKRKFKKRKTRKRKNIKPNAFMKYLRDRWNDEKRSEKGLKYREVIKSCSYDWKYVLTDQQKQMYKDSD
jgi:hypothetical protein